MTRDEARAAILENSARYFKADNSGKGYVCPICGSGTGQGKKHNGTGITTKDNIHFTCWRGCFKNADIFDIIGLQYGLNSYNEQLERACERFGITIDSNHDYVDVQPITANLVEDVQNFLIEAARHIAATNYHRGISTTTLKNFGVGYVAQWRLNDKAPYSPRLIIPHSDGQGYLARDTRSNLTDTQKKFAKIHKGNTGLFNPEALRQSNAPVFVVEGEIDALSIIDAGGCAVGLCSASNAGKFIEAVREHKPTQPIILVEDNDEAGRKAGVRLSEELSALNFSSYRHELPHKYKDANDFLIADRQSFTKWIQQGVIACKEKITELEQQTQQDFKLKAVEHYMNDFLASLATSREGKAIPTGFSGLDKILDGGLCPGLYVIGAISSLGKTTFALQIADYIASTGRSVLLFSLEMSRFELIAKSISRMTLISDLEINKTTRHAKTTRGILRGVFERADDNELVLQCVHSYTQSIAPNMYITEGIGDIGVEKIKSKIEQVKALYPEPPIVLIDYLQIIAPYNVKATDKQNIDKNVLELKRISRDSQIPIIGISSFNRENYNEPVSMASFKESGAIEYSSDVLIGLQYEGWDYREGEGENDRKKRLRGMRKEIDETAREGRAVKVQCKILKNRNGYRGAFTLDFYPMFNYFREENTK